MKRKPLEIKKRILEILKAEGSTSIKKLERKVNTNYQTILNNSEELAYFGLVKISKTKEGSLNGREYLIVAMK
jgi:predicted transcriptional regulator